MLEALLNTPGEFSHGGKTYRPRQLDLIGLAKLSTWLERRAREAVARAVDLPDEARDRMMSVVFQDIAAGVYSPGGEAFVRACTTLEGASHSLYLALCDEHPEVTEEAAREMFFARAGELAAVAAEALGDPKA